MISGIKGLGTSWAQLWAPPLHLTCEVRELHRHASAKWDGSKFQFISQRSPAQLHVRAVVGTAASTGSTCMGALWWPCRLPLWRFVLIGGWLWHRWWYPWWPCSWSCEGGELSWVPRFWQLLSLPTLSVSVIGSTSKTSGDSMSCRATGCKQGDRGGGGRGAEGGRSAGGGEVVRIATQRCQRPARAPIQNPKM